MKKVIFLLLFLMSVSVMAGTPPPKFRTDGGVDSLTYTNGTAPLDFKYINGTWVFYGRATGVVFNVKDFGAIGDSTTDESVIFQTVLDSIKALGGGIMYIPEGTYRTTYTMMYASNTTIWGSGTGSTKLYYDAQYNVQVQDTQPAGCMFLPESFDTLLTTTDVLIGNFEIATSDSIGNGIGTIDAERVHIKSIKTSQVFFHMIDIVGDFITVEDCYATNVTNAAIQIDNHTSTFTMGKESSSHILSGSPTRTAEADSLSNATDTNKTSSNITIINNKFDSTAIGIQLHRIGAKNVIISGNSFRDCTEGIKGDNADWLFGWRNLTITDNVFYSTNDTNDVHIVTYNSLGVIPITRRMYTNTVIANNTFTGGRQAISMSNQANVLVTGNVIDSIDGGTTTSRAISVHKSTGMITNNTLRNIGFSRDTSAWSTSTSFDDSTGVYGISIAKDSVMIVDGNKLENIYGIGIKAESNTLNSIFTNNRMKNIAIGILLNGNADSCIVTGNTFNAGVFSNYGIRIDTTSGTAAFTVHSNNYLGTFGTIEDETDSQVLRLGDYTIPLDDGTANQILKTDGSGSATWQADGGAGGGGSVWDTTSNKDTVSYSGVSDTALKITRDGTNDTTKISVPVGVLVIGDEGQTIVDSIKILGRVVYITASDSIVFPLSNPPPDEFLMYDADGDTLLWAKSPLLDTLDGSTYLTVQDWFSIVQGAGIITGGTISQNSTDSTAVDVTAGTGITKISTNPIDTTRFYNFADTIGMGTLTDSTLNYIHLEYNSGSPRFVVSLSPILGLNNVIIIGVVYREGNKQNIVSLGSQIITYSARSNIKSNELAGGAFEIADGTMLIGVSVTDSLYVNLTAGIYYLGVTRLTSHPFDSDTIGGGGDTWTYWHDSTGGWVKTVGSFEVDSDRYNDKGNGLVNATNNTYTLSWMYMQGNAFDTLTNPDVLHMVYDTADYTLTSAQAAQPLSDLPGILGNFSILVGKIITQEGNGIIEVISPFLTPLEGSATTNHNELAGIQGGISNEYFHLKQSELVDSLGNYIDSASIHDSLDIVRNEMPDTANIRFDSAMAHLDGMSYDKPIISVSNPHAGYDSLRVSVTNIDGLTDMVFRLDGVNSVLDCFPVAATVNIGVGADINNELHTNLYVTNSGGVATLVASVASPTGSFCWIGDVAVQDTLTFNASGVVNIHRHTEAFINNGRGTESYMREKLRLLGAIYGNGVTPTSSIVSSAGYDTLNLEITAGEVTQLHPQSIPARADGPYYYGNGQNFLEQLNSDSALGAALLNQDGTSNENKRFTIVIWGNTDSREGLLQDTAAFKIFVNLPSGNYSKDADAISDKDHKADLTVPLDKRGTAFLIARLALRHQSSTGDITILETFSLLGQPIGTRTGGVTTLSNNDFSDALFEVYSNADPTKIINFEAGNITTATTRTYVFPDVDDTLVTVGRMETEIEDSLNEYSTTVAIGSLISDTANTLRTEIGDSTALRLLITDTTAMLANYINATDTNAYTLEILLSADTAIGESLLAYFDTAQVVDTIQALVSNPTLNNVTVFGDINISGYPTQWNHGTDIDISEAWAINGEALPLYSDSAVMPDSSFLHPSVLYIPEGFLGYKVWMITTSSFGNGEEPFIWVTNSFDSATSHPKDFHMFIDSSDGTVGTGDTLYNPLFKDDDFGGLPKDGHLFHGADARLWAFIRINSAAQDSVWYVAKNTLDGLTWTDPDTIFSIFSDGGVGYVSPTIFLDTNSTYKMFAVELDSVADDNVVIMWSAPDPTGPWTLIDTTSMIPTNQTTRDIWHLDVVPFSPDYYLALIYEPDDGSQVQGAISIAKSRDGGLTWSDAVQVLSHTNGSNTFDDFTLYRASGYWVENGTELSMKMVYSAKFDTDDSAWRVGFTDVFFSDSIENIPLSSLDGTSDASAASKGYVRDSFWTLADTGSGQSAGDIASTNWIKDSVVLVGTVTRTIYIPVDYIAGRTGIPADLDDSVHLSLPIMDGINASFAKDSSTQVGTTGGSDDTLYYAWHALPSNISSIDSVVFTYKMSEATVSDINGLYAIIQTTGSFMADSLRAGTNFIASPLGSTSWSRSQLSVGLDSDIIGSGEQFVLRMDTDMNESENIWIGRMYLVCTIDITL